jgi:hypothetical protein
LSLASQHNSTFCSFPSDTASTWNLSIWYRTQKNPTEVTRVHQVTNAGNNNSPRLLEGAWCFKRDNVTIVNIKRGNKWKKISTLLLYI